MHFISKHDDRFKIFLTNLCGRINTKDLHEFFSTFGSIEHIESKTPKSAVILFSDLESVDRVLAKHRKCTINKQEIYVRRIRYGYIERTSMDSAVLFIQPVINHSAIEWTDASIRHCFEQYEMNIQELRIVSKYFHAFVHFNDYDVVDRILLQTHRYKIDRVDIEMRRGKCDVNNPGVEKLLEKNRALRKQIERHKDQSDREIKFLKHKINKLKSELRHLQSQSHHHK